MSHLALDGRPQVQSRTLPALGFGTIRTHIVNISWLLELANPTGIFTTGGIYCYCK
jgi:hypothetical protein